MKLTKCALTYEEPKVLRTFASLVEVLRAKLALK